MIKVQYSVFVVITLLCAWLLEIRGYEITLRSDGDIIDINCDENENGFEPLNKILINETIIYPSIVKIYYCPLSKKPYLEALREININASRVSQIWFGGMTDIEQLTDSLLQGMPLRRVLVGTRPVGPIVTHYEVSSKATGNLDLANGDNYAIHCSGGDDDLLNLKALLPNRILNVSTIAFYDCPPPNVSYYDIFQKININPTSVKVLGLKITAESLQLESGHFQGLSLNALKVDNNNNELDTKIFEVVAVDDVTLRQVELETLRKWRIMKAELKDGKFVGEWGDCSMLTSLELIQFVVPAIPGGWLRNCHNLTALGLRRLNRKAVDQTLMGARALEKLVVEDCNIGTLRKPFAVDAVNLRILNITDDSMLIWSVKAFSSLEKLEELDLAGNNLDGYQIFRAITPLGNLSTLTIDKNPVKSFCDHLDEYKLKVTTEPPPYNNFVPGVERLYLRHSPLSSVCFQDWHNLTYLDLSHNKISEQLQLLQGLPVPRKHPLTVDLRGNPLRKLHSTIDIEQFKGSQNITFLLNLTVDCDCEHSSLVNALHELPQISLQNVTCTSGVRFVDFHGDRFDCYKYPCGNCTCRTSLDDGATVADCGPGRLYTFPEVWSSLKESSELRNEVFLRKILAPNNFIEKLPEIKYPDSLIEVDLSNNQFTRILGSALDALFSGGKVRVRLSRNPLVCECDTQDMLDALSENKNQVLDYAYLTCSYSGKKIFIYELANRSLCTERTLVGFGIVSLSVLALAAITAFIYVRYKLTIKVFLYARSLCLSCVREEELDADREFDAFVSFAHPDDEFVADILLPGLENDYKLCVHTRNWMLGQMIHTQIMESVQKSRRTIIVLSKSFLESVWGMTEFRTAYSNSLREGRVRVICIVVNDVIDDANLDPELKSYLKNNTYLKFDDPWFWQKLRYAMPHPSVTRDQSGARNQNQSVQENGELELASI